MATPGQLVETLHLVTGIPLPTIVDLDRKLVKGSLRTKGGRGLHAAQMTPLDAARLITALLGSSHANAAVDAVQRYDATICDRDRSSDEQFGPSKIEELTSLAGDHSFVDALAKLISAISTGSLAKLTDNAESAGPHIEIFALTRATRGRIRISGLPNGLTTSMEYIVRPLASTKRTTRRGMAVEQGGGDLEQSRRITEQTIFRVAKILA